jgi:hypothetical protein
VSSGEAEELSAVIVDSSAFNSINSELKKTKKRNRYTLFRYLGPGGTTIKVNLYLRVEFTVPLKTFRFSSIPGQYDFRGNYSTARIFFPM